MKCPVCDIEMYNHSYLYYGLADWDMDYPSTYYEEYICKSCGVKYRNGEWKIPEKYIASDKQIRCCKFIEATLGVSAPPPTKCAMWKYINSYLQEASREAKRRRIISDIPEFY